MKKILMLILTVFALAPLARATPITPTAIPSVTGTVTLRVGQAPSVNHFAANTTPFYRISWRTIVVSGTSKNYLTSFAYSGAQFWTADNVYAATTYAEIQTEATTLGITNLPADPNAGH